jgi:hypothetical protein
MIVVPFHAARQLAHIGIFLVVEAHGSEDFVGLALAFRDAVEAGHQLQHFKRGEEGVCDDFLVHHAYGGAALAGVLVDIEAPDACRAGRLVHQARQNVDEGRLARPVRPQQAEDGSARNFQADSLQGMLFRHPAGGGVHFLKVVDFDCIFRGGVLVSHPVLLSLRHGGACAALWCALGRAVRPGEQAGAHLQD